MKSKILTEFDKSHDLYVEYETCLKTLIGTLLNGKAIKPQSISSRVKKREDLSEKLDRHNKDYGALCEVTDICGIRIITYFKEDVDEVAAIIENEFSIDLENSVDKRKYEDPDRFGYQSLHYIVSLDKKRCRLAEYTRFSGLKAEIQIRTVIQHAWAEIEHDLGYKSAPSIPRPIKRRFYRLAAMLEVADDEFTAIKTTLQEYEKELPQSITNQPKTVAIDKSTIRLFIETAKIIKQTEKKILTDLGIASKECTEDSMARYAEYLQWTGISTIDALTIAYEKHLSIIEILMKKRLKNSKYKELNKGITLLYLCYAIMGKEKNQIRFMEFLTHFDFTRDGHEEFTKEIISLSE
jgi:ppGpp synthetase/RelA/SpoT-type nucleotidyltranferase